MRNTLRKGASGTDVADLQTRLTALGFPCGEIDGEFGAKTQAAVEMFQEAHGLTVDGVVGVETWALIDADGSDAAAPVDCVLDFVRWSLTHVKAKSIPSGATLLLPVEDCGADPWEYLYGTSGRVATKSLLNEKYNDPYKGWDWPRDLYDRATSGWVERGQIVCDCQGLLDAYCTKVLGVRTDLNAHGCYSKWCTDKGRIAEISRAYVIGEAIFRANKYGTMKHVGWVCGFDSDGEPLVVEERGLSYGCVVTRLSGRGWTHRGLMTVRFNYDAPAPSADAFYAVCSGGSVNLRTGAGKQFDIIAVAHKGDLVLSLPAEGGWCPVAIAVNGNIEIGFMSEKYVEVVKQ